MDRILKKAGTPLTFAVIAAAGLFLGAAAGSLLVRLYFSGESRAIFFFTEPAVEYQHIRARIASESPEDRAVAYYALLDYGKSDAEFLIERFRGEKSFLVKRIIVWSLGFSGSREEVLGFIRKAYGDSPLPVRKEMLKTLDRQGGDDAEALKRELIRVR